MPTKKMATTKGTTHHFEFVQALVVDDTHTIFLSRRIGSAVVDRRDVRADVEGFTDDDYRSLATFHLELSEREWGEVQVIRA